MKEGDRTPWGAADYVKEVANGIWIVGTPSHGGVKLAPHRNKEVPTPLRRKGGWYEEDCEAAIAMIVFPEALKPQWIDFTRFVNAHHATVKNWLPYEYEQAFGVTVHPADSYIKRRDIFVLVHADDFVVSVAWGAHYKPIPEGMVGVLAVNKDQNAEKYFLVPKDEYDTRGEFGFVIDLDKHQEWEDHA